MIDEPNPLSHSDWEPDDAPGDDGMDPEHSAASTSSRRARREELSSHPDIFFEDETQPDTRTSSIRFRSTTGIFTPDEISDTLSARTDYLYLIGHGRHGPYGLRAVFIVMMHIFGHGLGLWILRLVWIAAAVGVSLMAMYLSYLQSGGAGEVLASELLAGGDGSVRDVRAQVGSGVVMYDLTLNHAGRRILPPALNWIDDCLLRKMELKWDITKARLQSARIAPSIPGDGSGGVPGTHSRITVDLPRLLDWLKQPRPKKQTTLAFHVSNLDVTLRYVDRGGVARAMLLKNIAFEQTPASPQPIRTLSVGGLGTAGTGAMTLEISANGIWRMQLKRIRIQDPELNILLDTFVNAPNDSHWWSGMFDRRPEGVIDAELVITELYLDDISELKHHPGSVSLTVSITSPDVSIRGWQLIQKRRRLATLLKDKRLMRFIQRVTPAKLTVQCVLKPGRLSVSVHRNGQWPLWFLLPDSSGATATEFKISDFNAAVDLDTRPISRRAVDMPHYLRNIFGTPVSLKNLKFDTAFEWMGQPISVDATGGQGNGDSYNLAVEMRSQLNATDRATEASGWRVRVNLLAGARPSGGSVAAFAVGGFAKDAHPTANTTLSAGYALHMEWIDDPISAILRPGGLENVSAVLERWGVISPTPLHPEDVPRITDPVSRRLNEYRLAMNKPPRRPNFRERLSVAYGDRKIRFTDFEIKNARIEIGSEKIPEFVLDNLNLKGRAQLRNGDAVQRAGLPRLGGDILQITPLFTADVLTGEMRFKNRINVLTGEDIQVVIQMFLPLAVWGLSEPSAEWKAERMALMGFEGDRNQPEPVGVIATIRGAHPSPWKIRMELPANITHELKSQIAAPDGEPDDKAVLAAIQSMNAFDRARRLRIEISGLPAKFYRDFNVVAPNILLEETDTLNYTYDFMLLNTPDGHEYGAQTGHLQLGPISLRDRKTGLTVQGLELDIKNNDRTVIEKTHPKPVFP